MGERILADGIGLHRARLDGLSDEALLATLMALDPLPQVDDDDPVWDDDATWDQLELLIAIADSIGDRRLVRAIGPLFERAALGDAYDFMQSIRHGPEKAVAPEWRLMTHILRPLVHHHRPGCRRWAVRELGILRDVDTSTDLLAALADPEPMVREEACMSLSMVAQSSTPEMRLSVRQRLLGVAETDESERVRRQASWAVEKV